MSEKQNPPLAKFLQIKQEDKTFVRLLSKEQSSKSINNNLQSGGESSFRVMYYGGATGSIPFRWESRPGTPKHALFSDTCSLPPLTPPPSYQFNNSPSNSQEKGTQQKSKKFHTIFSKFGISSRKTNITPISSSSSSSSISSSSCSNSSSSYSFTSQKNAAPQSRSPLYVDDNNEHHHDQEHEHEPTRATSSRRRRHNRSLTFCCGSSMNDGRSNGFGGRGHLEVKSFRKGLLSIFATHATASTSSK